MATFLLCEFVWKNVTLLAQISMQLVLLDREHGLQLEVKVSDRLYPTAYIRSYESNPSKFLMGAIVFGVVCFIDAQCIVYALTIIRVNLELL